MSEPVLKKQKLVADELCRCTSLTDAAQRHPFKCVTKYITDLNKADIRSSVLRLIKHEVKESQHKECTECVAELLAAGASVEPVESGALSQLLLARAASRA
jgi:hypothetical protein